MEELVTTKRYLLFVGEVYYPAGGSEDIEGSFSTLAEAVKGGEGLLDSIEDLGGTMF